MFSGGLDSLAGTAASIFSAPKQHFVLVSAAPNIRQRFRQQQQVEVLRRKSGASILHVSIPYGIKDGDGYAQEPSRRTRGFLFLVLGGVVALSAGSAGPHIYENGIGAINLPYDQSQIGTDTAKAVHPRVLWQVAELLGLAVEKPFSIVNPCIYLTKAEMLCHPSVRQVLEALPLTFSCDGFPVRAEGKPQCGFCTSCLLRRFSLEIAGLDGFDAPNICGTGKRTPSHPQSSIFGGFGPWIGKRCALAGAAKKPIHGRHSHSNFRNCGCWCAISASFITSLRQKSPQSFNDSLSSMYKIGPISRHFLC